MIKCSNKGCGKSYPADLYCFSCDAKELAKKQKAPKKAAKKAPKKK